MAAQDRPEAYPRLGAHRTLASVLADLGRAEEAREHLRTCVRVAGGDGLRALRRVGAAAAGEALLAERGLLPAAELEKAWGACFADAGEREAVLRAWVY